MNRREVVFAARHIPFMCSGQLNRLSLPAVSNLAPRVSLAYPTPHLCRTLLLRVKTRCHVQQRNLAVDPEIRDDDHVYVLTHRCVLD